MVREGMCGDDQHQNHMFSYLSPEGRVRGCARAKLLLRVRQSNWRGKLLTVKSKSSVRDLPLSSVLIEMLEEYHRRWRFNPLGLLFTNAKGRVIASCYVRRDILHAIRERLGIERGGFHAFRHGLGTELMW